MLVGGEGALAAHGVLAAHVVAGQLQVAPADALQLNLGQVVEIPGRVLATPNLLKESLTGL